MTDEHPSVRLHRIARRVAEAAVADLEWQEGDRVVVILRHADSGAGYAEGYPEDHDGDHLLIGDLMKHVQVVGQQLGIGVKIINPAAN